MVIRFHPIYPRLSIRRRDSKNPLTGNPYVGINRKQIRSSRMLNDLLLGESLLADRDEGEEKRVKSANMESNSNSPVPERE